MRYIPLILLIGSLLYGNGIKAQQPARVVKFDEIERLLNRTSERIQVINFWATWCAPCIEELPYFEALNTANDQVEVTLISLDFADQISKVNNFIKRKNIGSQVLLLDEIDYNSWIDKVEKSWSGAIPATLIVNKNTGQRKFIERELKEGELEDLVSNIIVN